MLSQHGLAHTRRGAARSWPAVPQRYRSRETQKQMDLKGIIIRRRGKIPKTHFVTSPAPLIEEVEQQLKTVYGFTPLRSRKKSGPVEPVKYPARRRTFMGKGKMYGRETMDKEQVEMENQLNSHASTGALYNATSKPVSHQELLDGDEREQNSYHYDLTRKYKSQWWQKGQVGGGAVIPLENRFSNRGQPSSIDRIYETDTGPKSSLAKLSRKSLYGYSIGRDSVNRFPQKVLQTQASVGPGTYNPYVVSTKITNNWSTPSNFFANKFKGKKLKKDKSLLALQNRNRKRGLTPVGKKVVHKTNPWQPLNRGVKMSKAPRETFADKLARQREADNDRRELAIYKLRTGGDQAEFVPAKNLEQYRR